MKRDPAIVSRIMSAIKSKSTKPELTLGSAMWAIGLRYRKHYKMFGSPDFVFVKDKIAIFCDGDFWHGNNWKLRGLSSLEEELCNYSDYWKTKISRNVARDAIVSQRLADEGWTVIRLWASDIKKDLNGCLSLIQRAIEERRAGCSK